MRYKSKNFTIGEVNEWMDCRNKEVTVETNSKILSFEKEEFENITASAKVNNSLIIPTCFIGENVVIENSKIGTNVSLGDGTIVVNSNIDNSLIQENSEITNANLSNSMIGNFVKYNGASRDISLGDYSVMDFNHK